MKYLSRSLTDHEYLGFEYHSQCKGVKLVDLMFADDLLIFAKATIPSIRVIAHKLKEFSSVSGLAVSPSKSAVFMGCISMSIQNDILSILNMKKCSFPIKYLGVPLTFKKLRYSECSSLVTKITARVKHWSSMSLSYAERLQLVNYVLSGMQCYWA